LKSLSGEGDSAVLCLNVIKHFYVYSHRTASLREWFIRTAMRRPIHLSRVEFSLQNFNLQVKKGETVALVGSNGCGKSTVLRLLAGIYTPTTGTVTTSGRVTAVIELGAGLNHELTGAENIELYAAILGLGRKQLARHYQEIVDFTGLGSFIDMPVKYYSSGMQARLAFSVAINVQPDILLLDEVLAVGDRPFQEKCLERLSEFQSKGGTMVVASHDLDLVRKLCSRAVWLENGRTRLDGDMGAVLDQYRMRSGKTYATET
jgi:ABC-type polysaccharide/polyol phosphate transport system ATPase subunit